MMLITLFVISCGALAGSGGRSAHPHRHGAGGPPPKAESKAPEQATLVKMISWAEPAPEGCDADLEGSAPPASFDLAYTEAGGRPVKIENDPEKLFGAGWGAITRSERGLGFEKAGEFTKLDFDIVEELRCKCEKKGSEEWHASSLLNVKLGWRPGSAPSVTAEMRDGRKSREVRPVTINGRLAIYDFRFARPVSKGVKGECSSRFLVALGLDQPIE